MGVLTSQPLGHSCQSFLGVNKHCGLDGPLPGDNGHLFCYSKLCFFGFGLAFPAPKNPLRSGFQDDLQESPSFAPTLTFLASEDVYTSYYLQFSPLYRIGAQQRYLKALPVNAHLVVDCSCGSLFPPRVHFRGSIQWFQPRAHRFSRDFFIRGMGVLVLCSQT